MNGWAGAMAAAGACSAAAIVLIRETPRFAKGLPPLLLVALYMLIGGAALLVLALAFRQHADTQFPKIWGFAAIAAIGILLAALEAFFVIAAKQKMPLPDAMIIYNLVSLVLVAVAGAILYRDAFTPSRVAGLVLGLASVLCLLQRGPTP